MNDGNRLDTQDSERLLNRELIEGIVQRVRRMSRGGGSTNIGLTGYWSGDLRWARNRVSLASDRRNFRMTINREVRQSEGWVVTNQIDDASLEASIRAAERTAINRAEGFHHPRFQIMESALPYPSPAIWSDVTSNTTADTRAALLRLLTEESESKGMLSAGYVEMRIMEKAVWSDIVGQPGDATVGSKRTDWLGKGSIQYVCATQAQCSMTVRHPKGVGSGWAGLSAYDWAKIDPAKLATRALEKCLASLNPVAVEPGRYTVILEAQALNDLLVFLMRALSSRYVQELGGGPFSRSPIPGLNMWTTKLGLRIMDERITISSDPNDPEQGVLPARGVARVNWIDHGILTNLSYLRAYAVEFLREEFPAFSGGGYQISGGTSSIEDMVAHTKRGLLVTRFSNIQLVDSASILTTGYTRDGLWLIENGKISKAVKNLRFTESPLFALNNVEALGIPGPVFSPNPDLRVAFLTPAIVPPIKVNDFSFTSLADAI